VTVSDAWLVCWFVLGAAVSLVASWVLVGRLERIGARVGLSEALLGMVAALAADGPEVTSAVTALIGGHSRIGAGVVIGSNVFNLAALLGLGAIVAGRIALHRRVIVFEGVVAVVIAVVCLAVVLGALGAFGGLVACGVVLVPYVVISSGPGGRGWLPDRWRQWLSVTIAEEETELEPAIHPARGHGVDVVVAGIAVLVVIGASVAMEQSGSTLGGRHDVPEIVIGGLVLAAVTSLPNAVAAIYLAARGRGAATLSTALNSNALNVVAGLLLPGAIVGLGSGSDQATLIAACYVGFTVGVLGLALAGRGFQRATGVVIVLAYLVFVIAVTRTA
jgi:cation:H+ antiporter